MTEEQRPTNSDQQRSILQHLMFGVLFVLILMNWSVHRPIDYEPFNEMFAVSEKEGDSYRSFQIQKMRFGLKEESDTNSVMPYLNVMTEIDSCCRNEIEIIKVAKSLGKDKKNQMVLIDSILGRLDSLRNYLATLLFYRDSRSEFLRYVMINTEEINFCRNTLHCKIFPLEYLSQSTLLVMLNSLQNKVENTRRMCFDNLFGKVHVPICFFSPYRAACLRGASQFYILGDSIATGISLVDFSIFSRKYSLVTVDNGILDLSEINSERIAYWNDDAKYLGRNTVNGTIRRLYLKDTITRPFSFSYFVSAPGIAMHADKANVCYVGVDNPISIHIPGYPAEKLKLKVAHAKVTKKEDGLFEVYFDKLPKGKVYAYVDATNEQGRTSRVHSMELRVNELPPPITNFDAYKESGIEPDQFFKEEGLEVFAADSAFAMDYEVISFQVEGFTAKHQYFSPITVYGEEFSGNHELVSILNTISAGDRLIISDIKARAANDRIYEADPVSVLLK